MVSFTLRPHSPGEYAPVIFRVIYLGFVQKCSGSHKNTSGVQTPSKLTRTISILVVLARIDFRLYAVVAFGSSFNSFQQPQETLVPRGTELSLSFHTLLSAPRRIVVCNHTPSASHPALIFTVVRDASSEDWRILGFKIRDTSPKITL